MANKDKLYIVITDEREGGGTPKPTPSPSGTGDKEDDDKLSKYIEHEALHFVKSQVTQFVNYSINNIGNFTGDYITQRKVNDVKQGVNALMGIISMGVAGAKYGGAVGAAIGVAVGVGSTMINSLYQTYTSMVENKKTNYSIAQLRERSGLNTTRDGSRGTEN